MSEARNQLKRRIAPGIWEDVAGAIHFSIPELMEHFGLPPTQKNRQWATQICREILLGYPGVELIERKGLCPACGGMLRLTEPNEQQKGELCCYICGQFCSELEAEKFAKSRK
jgi:hypothetical protein